ncbi:acetyl-CoA carboxylase biotin carboxylase subunit family protein [Desulforhopalus sp. IMCC35007]|uniref:ATP-grasp domain-containing protein n=1 Tax=Desulforhopalus sp. IMCC35007 TaxID=2569543 RepID=UPI00145E7B09|nr:ATP-grasp domain-containing protein [Desulforhopalus sp. IMCC35007]
MTTLDLFSTVTYNQPDETNRKVLPPISAPKILVVGSNTDYIELLRHSNPGHAVFLTAQAERNKQMDTTIEEWEELSWDLEDDGENILQALKDHISSWKSSFGGIVCYDCDSLELAAFLAEKLQLPYPSTKSIRHCRDKNITKKLWRQNGLPCPRHRKVTSAEEVFHFWQEIEGPCVLKPLAGSGSDLVFLCTNRKECDKSSRIIQEGLQERKAIRLYRKRPVSSFLAEEYIAGEEFSCDFTIRDRAVEILRLTRKIKFTRKPFGTIDAYMICDWQDAGLQKTILADILLKAADALGLSNALCMVDFIVNNQQIFLLEMSPRPGGDCIPALLFRATGFDILSRALEFAGNQAPAPISKISGNGLIALRLHAETSGEIVKINTNSLYQDPRTREINIVHSAGHLITMPPDDYDSWYLGYVLFRPVPGIPVEEQCLELRQMLDLDIKK